MRSDEITDVNVVPYARSIWCGVIGAIDPSKASIPRAACTATFIRCVAFCSVARSAPRVGAGDIEVAEDDEV